MAITGRGHPQSTRNRSNQSWSFSQLNLQLPYTETFTGADSSAWPGFWTTGTDGIASAINIQSNTGRITLGTTGAYGAYAVGALNTFVTGHDVTGTVTVSDDSESIIRLFVGGTTISGGFVSTGYALLITPGNNEIQLERFISGSGAGITPVSSFAIAGGSDTVNFRVRKVGQVIAARVWLNAASEPTTWNLATVDNQVLNGTYIGLSFQGGNVGAAKSASFDNVVISESSDVPAVPTTSDTDTQKRWGLVTLASGSLPHAPTNGAATQGSRFWLLGHQPYYPALTAVNVDAGLASGSGTAYNPPVSVQPNAGLVSSTGTAYNTPNLINPQAGLVSATGTAYTVASIDIKVSAGLASATGTAHNPPNLVQPNAELASGSGTAYDATISVSQTVAPDAGLASATGTAHDATVTAFGVEVADAGLVSATGTAYDLPVSVKPNAGLVSATGAAYTVGSITISLTAGLASATGTAYNPPNLVAPNAGLASSTGTAYDATITAVPFVNVAAGLAQATATAYNALAAVAPNAGLVSATGTAYGASISFGVQAGLVSATGTAYNPSVTAFGVGVANAEAAAASGTAYDPTTAIKSNAGLATASGAAYTVGSITIAFAAGLASASATAYDTPNLVAPSAGLVTATATAYDTTIDAYPAALAPAGVAEAVGTAYNPTIATTSGDIVAEPQVALASGTAYSVTISVGVSAEAAQATGTAYNASVAIGASAEVAQATGDAHNAIEFNNAEPTVASATATTYDAAISIRVNVEIATQATATAYDASVVAYPVTLADAGLVTASGAAYDATAALGVQAGSAQGTGSALDASVEVHPYVTVPAGLATATGSSYLASIAATAQADFATATGAAYLALITLQTTAGTGSATATGYDTSVADTTSSGYSSATATAESPALGLAINAELASATATAHDATVLAPEYVRVNAGVATATATAYAPEDIAVAETFPAASITIAAQTLTVTVMGAATLVAATATVAAQTLTITPSMVMVNLPVATATYAAQTLTVTPGTGSVNLVPATSTITPATLTEYNDISKLVDHHAAALGFQAIGQRTLVLPSGALDDKDRPWALRGYDRGLVAAPVPPVTITMLAQDLTVTAGAVTQDLGVAAITVAAIQFGINGKEIELPSAATITLQGQTLVPVGGAVTVDLGAAVTVTISGEDLSLTNNPRLSPASIDFEAQTLVPEILRGSISQFFPGPVKVFQGTLTSRTDLLYEVPEGFFLMIKEVTLQKIGSGNTATRLWSVPLAQNTSAANAFMYDVPVVDYIDQKMDMVLSAGERLYARCAADGQVVCRVDGYLLSNKSLPTPRVFFRGLVSDTYAEVAVTDLSAVGMVKFVSIANTTANERTIDISTTISGIAPTDSGAIRRSLAVPGNSSVFIPMTMVLSVSEALAVKADVGGALSVNVSGATAPRSVAVLSRTEIRPHNYAVNHATVVDGVDYDSTTQWPDWAFDDSSYRALVTGDFQGTTDEIFRWAATKWDINVDLIRAVAVQESAWDARTNGDGGLSFGLMQVKPSALGNVGTNAATVSSAWNVDYWCAWFRTVYDGKGKLWRDRPDLTNRVYTAGDLWGSVESWYTGVGPSEASAWYSANIRHYIEQRPWETDPDFINQVGNWAWV